MPKIITHKWKFGNLLKAPNTLPMKGLFVTKFESKANSQLQNYKKKVLNFGGYSLFWCFTQFGVLLSPMALKVVGPLLLDSNSSRDDSNHSFQFSIQQLTNKETKRQAITKDQNMR